MDRDGTLNVEVDYVSDVPQLKLLPRAAAAVRRLNQAGIPAVLITNQGGVAKGLFTEKKLAAIHGKLVEMLAAEGARLDAIFYCPHHPEGTVKEYAIACACRKPGIGMIEKAARELGINLGRSFFVGDMTGDILAGRRAGLTTILVRTGAGGGDGRYEAEPHFVAEDVFEAVDVIEKYI